MNCGNWNQERHSISSLDGGLPPGDVRKEILYEIDWFVVTRSKALGRQASVKKQSSCKDNITRVEQFAGQDSEVVFSCSSFGGPDVK